MILTEARSRDQRIEVLDMLHARSERLAELRRSIAEGTYAPDCERIAREIISRGDLHLG